MIQVKKPIVRLQKTTSIELLRAQDDQYIPAVVPTLISNPSWESSEEDSEPEKIFLQKY